MLNDLRAFTRLSTFFQVMPAGFAVAIPLLMVVFDDSFRVVVRTAPWLFGLMLVSTIGWAAMVVTWSRRAARAVQTDAQDGTLELLDGRARPSAVVPGRVTVARPSSGYRTGLLGSGAPPVAAGRQVVLTVLPPAGPPRRLCVLAPAFVPPHAVAKDTLHRVALHPTRAEVGAFVAGPVDHAALAADPRWSSGDLPTNSSVVGGYRKLPAIALAAVATGVLISFGLAALLA